MSAGSVLELSPGGLRLGLWGVNMVSCQTTETLANTRPFKVILSDLLTGLSDLIFGLGYQKVTLKVLAPVYSQHSRNGCEVSINMLSFAEGDLEETKHVPLQRGEARRWRKLPRKPMHLVAGFSWGLRARRCAQAPRHGRHVASSYGHSSAI